MPLIETPPVMEGYAIVPMNHLHPELQRDILENRPNSIIHKKEMVAMYTSSVMEINNGDNSQKSLNVKLYNCLADFAQREMDQITNRTSKVEV